MHECVTNGHPTYVGRCERVKKKRIIVSNLSRDPKKVFFTPGWLEGV